MKLKNNLIKYAFIMSYLALLTSCKHHKIIGEHIGFHYVYEPKFRPTPPPCDKKPSTTINSEGLLIVTETIEVQHVIVQKEILKEKIKHSLYIDKKLNVIVQITSTDWRKKQYTYYGNGKVVNNSLQVAFFKREEKATNSGLFDFKTFTYPNPFIVYYTISTDANDVNCIRYDGFSDHTQSPKIAKEFWRMDFILHTPKQIKKSGQKWKN